MAQRAALRYEDLEAFPNDNLRREIVGGELYVTPSPTPLHQRVGFRIARALDDYARVHGGSSFSAPLDVVLSAQNVVEPDVLYIGADRLDVVGAKAILGVPSLVVEVVSPSTQAADCGAKRDLYARFAIPEYWIVDPDARTIERCSDPSGGRYRTKAEFDCDMPAATLPDLLLPFGEVFG